MQDFEAVISGLTDKQKTKAREAKADIESELSFADQGKYFLCTRTGVLRLGFRLDCDHPWVLTFRKID